MALLSNRVDPMRSITLFRLDHRTVRDQRITSHVALTARAMGCDTFLYTGERDDNMEASLTDVAKRWGGQFTVSYSESIRSPITDFDGIVVHLTMYGENHQDTITTLHDHPDEPLLIIVGGPKVPRYVYSLADFNTAIGWQPHSEVAATGIFLNDLLNGGKLYHHYDDANIVIEGKGSKSQRSARFASSH